MRIARWKWIGIGLSAAWLLIGPAWIHHQVENQVMAKNILRYRECRAGPTDPAICESQSLKDRNEFLKFSDEKWWQIWASLGLPPLIAAWVLTFSGLFGFRYFSRRRARPTG
jgi:hypothetical protein